MMKCKLPSKCPKCGTKLKVVPDAGSMWQQMGIINSDAKICPQCGYMVEHTERQIPKDEISGIVGD
jgi:ribosomal protein S27AE